MESNRLVVDVCLDKRTSKPKIEYGKIISFVVLLIFCVIWILPFFIMLAGSLRTPMDALNYPQELFVPHSGYSIDNYKILLLGEYPEDFMGASNTTQDYTIHIWFLNSCFSAIGGTLLYLFVASLAAYAFTFIDFKYRDVIFGVIIATLVIPGTATIVGNQSLIYDLGLNTSLLALIIPGLGGVYGMYLIKTFFSNIPKELIESAKMDGYSDFEIFIKIVLPLGKTVLFVQGLFGFMAGWNDLVWPQMLFGGSNNSHLWTLQVGMAYVINNSKTSSLIGTALAGGIICLLPVLIVYIIAQDKIIEGMASAGIKG